MRLLVTAPLTLNPGVLSAQIKGISPAAESLLMTQELWHAYSSEILPLVPTDHVKVFPLEARDFGDCALPVRQFEMIEQSEALLIIRSKSAPITEPHVHIRGLAELAHRNEMLVNIIDV